MELDKRQIEEILQDFGAAQSVRSTWEGQAQDIIDYMMPMRADIIAPEYETPGRDKMGYIYVAEATHAGQLMAAGVGARSVNPATDWFRVKTAVKQLNDDRDVKLWLNLLKEIFEDVFQTSGFYTSYYESLVDKIFLGSACTFVGEHPRTKVYYETLNLGECYPAMNQYGYIDKMYRKFMMSVRNLAAKFGEENLSAASKKKYEAGGANREERVAVLHAVRPRKLRNIKGRDRRNKRFEDVYLEMDNGHSLEVGGFDEFPYIFSRYDAASGQVMGRGPGWTALPAVMQVQQMESDRMTADQRALGPSYLLPSSLNGPMIDLTPNGITFIDAEENLQSRIGVFPSSNQLAVASNDIDRKIQEISNIFFKDLMLLAMDPKMTATQFMHQAQEKMLLLGPFVVREQQEFLTPAFRRNFNILWEKGEIPPPPPILMASGGQLRIEYTSALAMAQKAAANQGIISTLGFVEQAAQIDRRVVHRVNLDLAVQEVADNNGCPQKLLRSDKEVQALLEQEAKIQQEQQQQAMLLEAAKTMPHLAKGAEEGSPLEQINQLMKQGAGSA